MRTSTLTFLCLLAMTATSPVGPAAAQQPTDAAACRSEKDRQRAIEACSRIIGDATLPASVRADALVSRAFIYHLLGARDFQAAVETDPANTGVRKLRAYHYFRSGGFEQAIADYNEAIRMDPKDADAYRQRGDVWLMRKRYSEALADYRKAIELAPVDSASAWAQCRISASWTNAFFNCTQVADDMSQPAENRAHAQSWLDNVMGRSGTAQ